MSEDGQVNVPSDRRPTPPAGPADADRALTIELLERQLVRMRGMLGGYSAMFFTHMRVWTLAVIALLVVSRWEPLGGAVLVVPFLVPFVFLEASYLFFYAVFARRHAAYLEAEIGRLLGRPVLPAHTIEAAYFYDPAALKISALSLGRPLGHMSVMTVGYSAGAAMLWLTGLVLTSDWLAGASGLAGLIVPGTLLWTVAIVVYLLWTWLARHDERRLEAALRAAYPEVGPV